MRLLCKMLDELTRSFWTVSIFWAVRYFGTEPPFIWASQEFGEFVEQEYRWYGDTVWKGIDDDDDADADADVNDNVCVGGPFFFCHIR